MKRILTFLLTVCLMATLAPFTASAANITATMSSVNAERGETVALDVTLSGYEGTTSTLGIKITVPEGISIVNGKWGNAALRGNVQANGDGVALAPEKPINPNGKILTVNFKVEDDATCGDKEIKFEFATKSPIANNYGEVTETAGVITVHSFSDEWHFDESNHWRNCTACDELPDISEHIYDNACDAICNVCDQVREVLEHIYDNACDPICNVCDQVREVLEHVYDNACDTKCNVCEYTREITHDYNSKYVCTVCQKKLYTYVVNDGKATIFAADESIGGDIVIPSSIGGYPVVSIGYGAFFKCNDLTSITIPDSVTSIEDWAFYECKNLQSVAIGSVVAFIGKQAFFGCEKLKNITIPDSVTYIGDEAFSYCESLETVTLSNSVTSINYATFSDCYNLTIINIPDGVTNIGDNAFQRCTSLETIKIPNAVKSIGDSAFYACQNIKSIIIPDSVTYLGGSAFSECYNLTNATIGDSVEYIGFQAFSDCHSLANITIPDSVIAICEYAFSYCGKLESAIFENTKGWSVKTWEDDVIKHSSSVLANSRIAAEYLTDTYYDYIWTRTVLGDVDGEEGITANDAIYLLYNIFFGEEEYPVDQPCDFDGDNSVTANDAIYLLYHVFFGDEMYPLA